MACWFYYDVDALWILWLLIGILTGHRLPRKIFLHELIFLFNFFTNQVMMLIVWLYKLKIFFFWRVLHILIRQHLLLVDMPALFLPRRIIIKVSNCWLTLLLIRRKLCFEIWPLILLLRCRPCPRLVLSCLEIVVIFGCEQGASRHLTIIIDFRRCQTLGNFTLVQNLWLFLRLN